MNYIPCPEQPHPITGNVACDNWGYCPYGEVCNIPIPDEEEA